MRILRDHRLDAALLVLAVVVLAGAIWQDDPPDRVASMVGGLALTALLARRRVPLIATVVAFIGIFTASKLGPQATPPEFFSILATFGTVGTLERRRDAIAGWVVGCALLFAAMSDNQYVEGASDIALTLTFCTVIWAAGLLAAERGRQVVVERERAEDAESTRAERVREATQLERSRIAAELHDIVSHSLSIVVVQAVAARMDVADGADGDGIDRRIGVVESTARDALADMRRMLGLLDPAELPDDLGAGVGLGGLSELVEQVCASGVDVTLDVDEPPELPAGLDAACFRIVQESLTNVVRHAPGASAQVAVRRDGGRLSVTVECTGGSRSSARLPSTGRGLIGMRQRAELYGGHLDAGHRGDGFVVVATFPVESDEARPRRILRGRRRSS